MLNLSLFLNFRYHTINLFPILRNNKLNSQSLKYYKDDIFKKNLFMLRTFSNQPTVSQTKRLDEALLLLSASEV